jgi:hypothetical protein
LTDTSIVPKAKRFDSIDATKVYIEINGQKGRFIGMKIKQGQKFVNSSGHSRSAPYKKTLNHGAWYHGLVVNKNTTLILNIAKLGQKHVINFEFTDIKLP